MMHKHFHTIELSESKRPVLEEGEFECLLVEKVEWKNETDQQNPLAIASMTFTSHRIILLESGPSGRSLAVPISSIQSATKKTHFLPFKPSKVLLQFASESSSVSLSFRGKDSSDQVVSHITTYVSKRLWDIKKPQTQLERLQQQQRPSLPSSSSSSSAAAFIPSEASLSGPVVSPPSSASGIGGIMRSIEQKQAQTGKDLKDAFSDLQSLMDRARDLAELAERFAEASQSSQSSPSSPDDEISSLMMCMGLSNPVTKQATGSRFHRELARQLADFLRDPLQISSSGGMMLLPDVYCLYNRARGGTDLISPEDLLRSCQLFESLGLDVRLRSFESGVKVVQSLKMSDDVICNKIRELLATRDRECLSSLDLSRITSLSLMVAKQQLLMAEMKGVLCRDESPEGLFFYPNIFM